MFDQHEARAWREVVASYRLDVERLSWFGQAVTFKVLHNPAFNDARFGTQTYKDEL